MLEYYIHSLTTLLENRKARSRSLPAKRGRESEQETSISHDENDPGVANQAASKCKGLVSGYI